MPNGKPWAILRPLNNTEGYRPLKLMKKESIFGTDAQKCDFVFNGRFGNQHTLHISPIHAKIRVNPEWDTSTCLANICDCSTNGIWLSGDRLPKNEFRLVLQNETIDFIEPNNPNKGPISYIISKYDPNLKNKQPNPSETKKLITTQQSADTNRSILHNVDVVANTLWKFNPNYRDKAIHIISQKVGWNVTPNIDCCADEANKQYDMFITEHADFLSDQFKVGAFGKSWRTELIAWINAPFESDFLMSIVSVMKHRKMRGLFCGPSNESWKKCKWYKQCKQYSKGIWHLFKVMNNPEYRDVFFPVSTNYQKGVGPPPFDVIVFWLDFTR